MNKLKEYFAPTIVLVVICFVVTLALAVTYQITTPIIAKNAAAVASSARVELLPSGKDGFEPLDVPLADGIKEIYTAKNKSGYVITSVDKGFGGELTVMTGIDSKGKITGTRVVSHTETPGLGTKAMTKEYLSQYLSQSNITVTGEPDATNIDTITGATITSKAVFRAIEKSLQQFNELGGV